MIANKKEVRYTGRKGRVKKMGYSHTRMGMDTEIEKTKLREKGVDRDSERRERSK